jgi:DNA-directed RNA polymerase specialized sigma24 family protein
MTDQLMQTKKCSKIAQVLAVSARELAEMLDVSLRQVQSTLAAAVSGDINDAN